jgi:hypothetical protein
VPLLWLHAGVDPALTATWLYPWLGASLGALVVFELIRHAITKALRTLRHRWIALRALRGEQHAEDLLVDAGYQIVGRQVEGSYLVRIDESATRVVVRADLLVKDPGGRTLVAEVKTGREAPRIENSATRRQLLEYRLAFEAPGVLLVDAGQDTIHTVRFPMDVSASTERVVSSWMRAAVIGFLVGVAAAIGTATYLGRLDLG